MTGRRPVLSDFVPDVRAIADVEAFGVVLDRPGQRAQLVTRHRAGVAAHLLPADRLPPALRPGAAAVRSFAPLCEEVDAAHPMMQRLLGYGIECLLVQPLPGMAGLFWTGKVGAPPFDDAQVAAFAALASRLVAAMHVVEPPAQRLARLVRIDAVEQLLPVV